MSFLSAFHNDPFFSGFDLPRAPALDFRSGFDNLDRQITQRYQNDDQTLDIFRNPFVFMQNMIDDMGQMMSQMETRMNNIGLNDRDGQGLSFSSSTVMSMDSRNNEQPRIIQATSEKLHGPEGFARTRKAVRDTGRNLEKMEVAHRLGERGHRITKERDPSTGRLLENREFDHIDDENAFEWEWFNRAEQYGLKTPYGRNFSADTNNLLMEPSSSYGRLQSPFQEPRHLAIEQPPPRSSDSRHKERRY